MGRTSITPGDGVISLKDDGHLDAFGRLRVSNPLTVFDTKLIFDKAPLFWTELLTAGGTITHNADRASVLMEVTSSTGDKAERRTKQYWNYQPGHSQMGKFTCVFGARVAGIRKRYGLFDAENGVFFEDDGTDLKVVRRSFVTGSAVDTAIPQSDWNIDKLDGSGPSKLVFLPTFAQILLIDYQWLGTGRIRFGVNIRGQDVYVHEILTANVLTSVWASTPNLPVAAEIENVSSSSADSLEIVCSSVTSEGGSAFDGFTTWVSRGNSGISGNNIILPIISLRLQAAKPDAEVKIKAVSLVNTSNNRTEWAIYVNPDIAGTDEPAWANVPNTAFQIDTNRDNTNLVSGGHRVAGGYFSSDSNEITIDIDSILGPGSDLDGSFDEWVLAAHPFANDTLFGGLEVEQRT